MWLRVLLIAVISMPARAATCNANGGQSCQPNWASNGCDNCPAGQYMPASSHCDECHDDSCSFPSSCIACPAGMYQSSGGATRCEHCPTDTYQPSTGATSCAQCPYGYWSDIDYEDDDTNEGQNDIKCIEGS